MRLYYRDATTGVLMDTDVSDIAIGFTGSSVDRPQSSGYYFIRTWINGWWIDLGYASVSVALPTVNGKPSVNITQPNQNGLFAQAINTQNAFVHIAGTLDLDLSDMDYLCVRPGGADRRRPNGESQRAAPIYDVISGRAVDSWLQVGRRSDSPQR
jgi:hypothetical protein